ncbi:hypothetical protein NP233_g7732 [Leucocoprinus birnbaumii]|uniref:DUF323 domain-containing protein n=1 Tax=Leucocoprinus birnbaumii TaxID=56174 RepID=A0AAD5VNS3_9AGAR|nr:hypothetical protein NP233_g7732 [Leucocoprinus birnbaumii]
MPVDILQLHSHSASSPLVDIAELVDTGLSRRGGEKTLPTILLYDEIGLRLYDTITTDAPEYYLFAAEEQILEDHVNEIVKVMHSASAGVVSDEVVLELGAGALRKTSHILSALARSVSNECLQTPITYYALDLEQKELERTLRQIQESEIGNLLQGKVITRGICGTYDDGLKYISEGGLHSLVANAESSRLFDSVNKTERAMSPTSTHSSTSEGQDTFVTDTPPSSPGTSSPPLHIMFLGSSIGNFSRSGAIEFLRGLPLRAGSGDTLLIGLDHDNDPARIERAYDDSHGHTENFIKNGLRAAGRVLGDENLFAKENWEYVSQYDTDNRRHEAFLKPKMDHSVIAPNGKVYVFEQSERIKIEESFKFSDKDAFSLFTQANLRPVQRWVDRNSEYSLWLVERPAFVFPLLSSPFITNRGGELIPRKPYSTSSFGIPARQDWNVVWTLWDFITLRMIPRSMLLEKPIDLRHICLFYLGHIPAFLDIYMSRLLQEPFTQPEEYKRGIDPDVDDPTQCNPHSEVPTDINDWPALSDIVDYQHRVRARVMSLYDDIDSGRRPITRRMGRVLFMTYEHEGMHAETLLYMLLQRAGTGTVPPPDFMKPDWSSLAAAWNAAPKLSHGTVTLGPESVTIGHDDVEAEDARVVEVTLPDDHEYGWDNENPKRVVEVQQFEISWRPVTNGEFYEFYLGRGKDKIELPASWVVEDGEVKVRTLYGPVPMDVAKYWPVITSYDSLSSYAIVKGGRLPTEPELRLFFDKFHHGYDGGANVGFRNWHPLPATTGGSGNGGKGCNGGVWEWTSTVMDKVDGFSPSKLYPGYSKDFFDGKHNIVIGGSYVTVPQIAERRSFRNWYQRNYPYPWVGGRIVYDIKSKEIN